MGLCDVSDWTKDEERQASGTREKFWLIHPDNTHRYLFKIPKGNTGEAWAEVVASKIGQRIGLNMMEADLAVYDGIVGVLSRNFVFDDAEFYEGGDLFFTIAEDFDRYNLKHYHFLNIIKVLSEFHLEKEFVQIPIFDALIANQDRHCDNWGVIVHHNGYKLAPIYDNGASLGYQLKEERILKMFQDQRMFDAFTNRSFSLIGLPHKRKPKYKELLSFIYELYPKEVKREIERISQINIQEIITVFDGISDNIMSKIYKEWVSKLLQQRKEWLLNWYMEVR
ncbi:toxin HipA [Geobacillus subterraneus]|uniref:Toxin HipA n=2 Tax=Geobacillus TaxID=129337 RepID=A0ABN4NEU5_9BACL|nr:MULTISPECIES: HipA domain-containing protein [Geobacillus]AMX82972.1 toxin HipA [Geobacillus subterraneus]KZS27254.1 toxin HipA [Geobacillus subterraneus]OXB91069.1 toxin HipA [Geobacillus uzenensis]